MSTLTGNVLVLFNSNNTSHSITSIIEGIVLEYRKHTPLSSAPFPKGRGFIEYLTLQGGNGNNRGGRKKNLSSVSRRRLRRAVVLAEEQVVKPWHYLRAADILKLFGADKNSGLSTDLVRERLKKYGPNILPESVPRSGLSIFVDQLNSLPVILLIIAAGVSALTGGLIDAITIMSVIVINATVGYVAESHSEKTIHSLKSLVKPTTLVIRNRTLEIGVEDVVNGDILVLRPGSYVAADSRVVEANRLSIDESALTGESMPVIKTTEAMKVRSSEDEKDSTSQPPNFLTFEIPLADRTNMIYMGTLVTGGQGLAVVVATGRFTEIGKIQTLAGEARTPETPMERQLHKIGTQLAIISSAICGVVFAVGILRGYGLFQMLKVSISLAVAAVPEGLPTVATTTLAIGIRKMRKYNVLIRHLDAVETLGSVQTICLDKTGTITMNRMSVVEIHTGLKRFKVSEGKFLLFPDKSNYINPYLCDELLRLIHISILCNESEVSKQKGQYIVNGTPTENALINAAISSGVDILMVRERFPVLQIQHRSETCNFMLTLHYIKIQGNENKHAKIIAIKGSPTEVLSMCNLYMKDGKKISLSQESRLKIEVENERMAGNALRVLGVAYAFADGETIKDGMGHGLNDFCSESLTKSYEFIWLGLIGMADPLRDGMKELISGFHKAGIDTVMITGDQIPTAFAVGKELNFNRGEQLKVLDSTHLANINPDVMKALSKNVHVFARVSPAHKLQIVRAFQKDGKVVAMTGDGINDGPALKAANIGVAMGHTGTDVAREVADVVLEDDDLKTMVIAVSHGRTISNNIRKSLHFLLSTNISEIMLMFTSITGGLGQPLNTIQLLWINLMSDIAPALALALEPPEPDVLSQPPRNPDEPIIKTSDFKRIVFESTMLTTGAITAYGYGIFRYGMGQQAGTMAFTSLTIGQLLHSISCRSEKHSIFDKEKLSPNKYLDVALGGSFILQVLVMAIPGLRNLLGIAPLNIIDSFIAGGTAMLPLMINEVTKKAKG